MIADVNFMREKFPVFNDQMFCSRLPEPTFKVRNARTYRGKFFYERTSRGEYYTLVLSTAFDSEERDLEDILIHEMIHYYIVFRGIQDTGPHGHHFRALMKQLNSRFCRNITVSGRMSAGDAYKKVEYLDRECVVCVLKMTDERRFLARVPNTKIFEFHRFFSRQSKVLEQRWYSSFESAFQYYPASRTPKVYNITADAEIALRSFKTVEMEFKGNCFQMKEL